MNSNSSSFSNSMSQRSDILDFLDNVKRIKVLNSDSDFDIVDIVKSYYGISTSTMSENGKETFAFQTSDSNTLSRMSRVAEVLGEKNQQERIRQKISHHTLEDWEYLFEERAAIYEFESGYISRKHAEELAFKDMVDLFIEQNQINKDCQQTKDFIKQLLKITNQIIN